MTKSSIKYENYYVLQEDKVEYAMDGLRMLCIRKFDFFKFSSIMEGGSQLMRGGFLLVLSRTIGFGGQYSNGGCGRFANNAGYY